MMNIVEKQVKEHKVMIDTIIMKLITSNKIVRYRNPL